MQNKLQYIKSTWKYRHKLLIATIALAVAHIAPLVPVPELHAEPITYTKPVTVTAYSLDDEISRRALELYDQNRASDLERYRLDAIADINKELQNRVYLSPHIDYEELKARYGY
jgi:hypothetical protein